ncbi:MAG: helix-turn-helix transcriptional regulator [Paludibaculum sp.]
MAARLPNGSKPYLFPEGARFGADNVLLHASARRHRVEEFAGPLSIKTVMKGSVGWVVSGQELLVDPASFLVLGAGEKYSMNIDSQRRVETACAFFRDGFVEESAQDATGRVEDSLEDPRRPAPALPFLSRLHCDAERSMTGTVETMAERSAAALFPSGFEEEFLLLSNRLLQLYEQIRKRMARVPAVKTSTREELFRRLEKGREFLHGQAGGAVSLEEVARVACLSRYHFHRAFVQVYGQTPHGYLTRLRLSRAHAQLQAGQTVTETWLASGFDNASAFSRAFRKAYGLTPSTVRRG